MTRKRFVLVASISTDNLQAIKPALEEFYSQKSVTPTDEGFRLNAVMHGDSARELNRALLSALRRVERRTRLRAEWTSGGITERFFDYVPKGSRKA